MNDFDRGTHDERDDIPPRPFSSWGALYTVVAVWALAWILMLYVFTVTLDVGVAG